MRKVILSFIWVGISLIAVAQYYTFRALQRDQKEAQTIQADILRLKQQKYVPPNTGSE